MADARAAQEHGNSVDCGTHLIKVRGRYSPPAAHSLAAHLSQWLIRSADSSREPGAGEWLSIIGVGPIPTFVSLHHVATGCRRLLTNAHAVANVVQVRSAPVRKPASARARTHTCLGSVMRTHTHTHTHKPSEPAHSCVAAKRPMCLCHLCALRRSKSASTASPRSSMQRSSQWGTRCATQRARGQNTTTPRAHTQ